MVCYTICHWSEEGEENTSAGTMPVVRITTTMVESHVPCQSPGPGWNLSYTSSGQCVWKETTGPEIPPPGGTGGGGTTNPPQPPKNPVDCLTLQILRALAGTGASNATLQGVIDMIKEYAADFHIDSKAKLDHLISQMTHETLNFTQLEENKQFKIAKLDGVWPSLFNPISNPTANPNKANPNDFKESPGSIWASQEKLLNYVYGFQGNDLGNDQPGDGYKYRGRGGMHLTGKANYTEFTTFYNGYCSGGG